MDQARLGHTGITWPFTPDGATQGIKELASLGYRGFETFGFIIDQYPGGIEGLRDVLGEHQLQLVSAYCSAPLIDPATARDDIKQITNWAKKVKALDGQVVVVGASSRQQASYSPDAYAVLVQTLNEVGRRCLDLGVLAAFHPHTGTPVETSDEIDRVMSAVDPNAVFFAPDTGQIAKGGGDPLAIIRTYNRLIRHIHLKDFVGGPVDLSPTGEELDRTGYLNYVPLGDGVVDIPGIVDALEADDYDGWWMVELDGTPAATAPPREAAAISKRYLDQLAGVGSHD